jgi:hypothetical protein
MTKKTQKTTTAPKSAPLKPRKAGTRKSIATVSTANDRRSSLPPPVEAPTPAAAPGNSGLAPERGRAKQPAVAPRRRVGSAAPVTRVRGFRPVSAVDASALPTVIAARTSSAPEPTHDEIATRAYFISLGRGHASGNAEQDWVTAVSELRRERGLDAGELHD